MDRIILEFASVYAHGAGTLFEDCEGNHLHPKHLAHDSMDMAFHTLRNGRVPVHTRHNPLSAHTTLTSNPKREAVQSKGCCRECMTTPSLIVHGKLYH